LRGVDSVRGRKLPFPIDKASRRYHIHRASATAQSVINELLIVLRCYQQQRQQRYAVAKRKRKPNGTRSNG